VPLILSFPFRLEPGVVVETRSQNVDVWPTILDLVGLEPLEGADGRSLKPQILASARGEASAGDDGSPAFAHLDQHWGQRGMRNLPTVAVTEGSHRYVRSERANGDPIEELFDAERDPAEKSNRAGVDRHVVSGWVIKESTALEICTLQETILQNNSLTTSVHEKLFGRFIQTRPNVLIQVAKDWLMAVEQIRKLACSWYYRECRLYDHRIKPPDKLRYDRHNPHFIAVPFVKANAYLYEFHRAGDWSTSPR